MLNTVSEILKYQLNIWQFFAAVLVFFLVCYYLTIFQANTEKARLVDPIWHVGFFLSNLVLA